ncbi:MULTISPECIES: hypothetical protein [Paenibacillus]|uniref:Lipoprotein n=1 Tax=Paenibacillus albilobatus TaxID=2716884 RepID=A0A919XFZ7_9BACL|nr:MULTISPECIES: hypothetical protein [Paenibacillus]GIO29718.1 hypothetical protein J2TS6_08590 [Paenibacillus albilobatus]
MKFKKVMGIIALLSIVIVSGCGQELKSVNIKQEADTNNLEDNQETKGSTKDKIGSTTILYKKEFSTEKPELSNFKKGISFDLSDYAKDFFMQDIADKIVNNMEAIVQHNEKKFKENMLDDGSIEFNMDWFGYKYEDGVKFEFKDVNEITYDEDVKRIQIIVTFLRNIKDKEVEQGTMTYSLLKDKVSGQWLIATMDGN